MTIKIGVVGATGYTGIELLRLLNSHPNVCISAVTSRTEKGKSIADLFPVLRNRLSLKFTEPSLENLRHCDLVFFATPHGTAMNLAPDLIKHGIKVIDLSADFRIQDRAVWKKWYGMEHQAPELLKEAVYGLPELNREAIADARLVANPGCYPTAIQLGYFPLLAEGLIDSSRLIADAKSGVSGAGRSVSLGNLYSEVNENFKAYGVSGHRHHPEICQGLGHVAEQPIELTFTPHLTPMLRGIFATLYAPLKNTDVDLQAVFEAYYQDEPFVDVLPEGIQPEVRHVRGGNHCRISVQRCYSSDQVVVLSTIDNLVKGAAGQAIQNMNILFSLEETAGLTAVDWLI